MGVPKLTRSTSSSIYLSTNLAYVRVCINWKKPIYTIQTIYINCLFKVSRKVARMRYTNTMQWSAIKETHLERIYDCNTRNLIVMKNPQHKQQIHILPIILKIVQQLKLYVNVIVKLHTFTFSEYLLDIIFFYMKIFSKLSSWVINL